MCRLGGVNSSCPNEVQHYRKDLPLHIWNTPVSQHNLVTIDSELQRVKWVYPRQVLLGAAVTTDRAYGNCSIYSSLQSCMTYCPPTLHTGSKNFPTSKNHARLNMCKLSTVLLVMQRSGGRVGLRPEIDIALGQSHKFDDNMNRYLQSGMRS